MTCVLVIFAEMMQVVSGAKSGLKHATIPILAGLEVAVHYLHEEGVLISQKFLLMNFFGGFLTVFLRLPSDPCYFNCLWVGLADRTQDTKGSSAAL